MKKIKLTQGRFAIVDDEDYEIFSSFNWYTSSSGYAIRMSLKSEHKSNKRKTIILHRIIVKCPEGKEVDHINGDRLDNRRTNLRVCSHQQNTRNVRMPFTNTTGYKGVTSNNSCKVNPWAAKIWCNERLIYLGGYPTKEEAALAYNKKAKELFGEFALLNKVK